MSQMSCHYVTWTGQALGFTHFLPFLITGFLKVVSFFYQEPLWFFYGLYWFVIQWVLWLAQHYFQIERPDPFCAAYHTYAAPSSEVYYTVAAITAILTWTIYYKIQQSVQSWIMMYLFLFVPSGLLWFTRMNRWWEILWTALFAIVTTVPFTWLMIEGVGPNIDFIENCGVFSWYGWRSTYLRRGRDPVEIRETRESIKDTLETFKHLRAA